MKEDSGIKKYSLIIPITIFMLCISSVCMAGVVEFTDEVTFKNEMGEPNYLIDFESYGDGNSVPPGDVPIDGNEWSNLGIRFAAVESGESLLLYTSASVSPTHSLIVSGDESSYVITFTQAVESFGLYFVDSDYTDPSEQIVLKDSGGNTLGVFAIPLCPANSSAFRGYASDIPIAEVHIIEDDDGESVLLDDFMYSFSKPARVEMEWVTVDDADNAVDDTGYGSVDYGYRIGKYEVTNNQYCEFLKAVAATDTYNLYNTNMNDVNYGGIERIGNPGSYSYTAKSGRGNWPVNYVSFYDALRFANWMHNGQPTGAQDDSTTEDGAYDMNGDPNLPRKTGAKVWLTSEDEWYKAAYYKGGGTNAGYWDYPTESNTAPTAESPPGTDGVNGSANYNNAVGTTLTDVGAYTYMPSVSAYETFDQAGNVWEWNEMLVGSDRGVRGGSYGNLHDSLRSSYRSSGTPSSEASAVGFRVASFWPVVISPNGGEELIAGNSYMIQWESMEGIADVNIVYSINNGQDWNDVNNTVPNTGSYEWMVPEVTSNQCLVRISDVNDANIYDTSDDMFTIYVCQLLSRADLNDDCKVDFNDFSLFAQDWLRNGNPFDEGYTEPMLFIPGGEFEMGDHFNEGNTDELPVHSVNLDSFYISRYEVTNQQYCDFLNKAKSQGLIIVDGSGVVYPVGGGNAYCDTTTSSPYSRIEWDGSSFSVVTTKECHPMIMVNWYGAEAYCDYYGYRLPTEAEWEYAARGGEHDPYYRFPWGDSIDGTMANYWESGDPYGGTSPETTPVGYYDGNQIPAGSDMANGYGLYDMIGNVWEWCNDWYDLGYYNVSPYYNPTGPTSGTYRVFRGGSWGNGTNDCRVANRGIHYPNGWSENYGFRVVLDLE